MRRLRFIAAGRERGQSKPRGARRFRSRGARRGANVGAVARDSPRPKGGSSRMSPRLVALCVGLAALTAGLGYAAIAPYFEVRQEPPTREVIIGPARFVLLTG